MKAADTTERTDDVTLCIMHLSLITPLTRLSSDSTQPLAMRTAAAALFSRDG